MLIAVHWIGTRRYNHPVYDRLDLMFEAPYRERVLDKRGRTGEIHYILDVMFDNHTEMDIGPTRIERLHGTDNKILGYGKVIARRNYANDSFPDFPRYPICIGSISVKKNAFIKPKRVGLLRWENISLHEECSLPNWDEVEDALRKVFQKLGLYPHNGIVEYLHVLDFIPPEQD